MRKILKKKLLGLGSLERSIARKRSRLLDLHDDDVNTKFFHRHACHRQWKSAITTIRHGGVILTGHDRIASVGLKRWPYASF